MQTLITTGVTFSLQKVASTKQSLIGRKLSNYSPMTQIPIPGLVMLFCERARYGRRLPITNQPWLWLRKIPILVTTLPGYCRQLLMRPSTTETERSDLPRKQCRFQMVEHDSHSE